jgi:hypothetical protein
VNLARSFDPAYPLVTQRLRKHRDDFNGNVVVTAAHCIESRGGYMFAPAFTGIAPRYSIDFSTGKVSGEHNDQFGVGSPFEGEHIGDAPFGAWGCSHHRYADRRCGRNGSRDAEVFVPDLFTSGDNSYDYAFVVFRTAPPNRSRSLKDITGGLPIDFDAGVPKGTPLRSIAYDVTWVDANKPGDTSGWYDLVSPPDDEQLNQAGGNCGDGPVGYDEEVCSYSYLASLAGPRTCAPTADGYINLTIPGNDPILSESRPSLLASPCYSGGFASGAPYIMVRYTGEHVVVGVNKTSRFHAGPQADPVPTTCCTAIITPLRRDAAFQAFRAETLK